MKFSEYFQLNKKQEELDFVDIPIDGGDLKLFIDPYAISIRKDIWSQKANSIIVDFFNEIVQLIRDEKNRNALDLLSNLREPNETHLGYSKHKSRGSGIGGQTAKNLHKALSESSAVKTGFLSKLEETELMVDGISHDRISDLTTNVIKQQLIEYTISQCELLHIPLSDVPVSNILNTNDMQWESAFRKLPIVNNSKILLVPKIIARHNMSYDSQDYYNNIVLNFLQTEHIRKGSSLVKTLKNGKRRVTKKILKAIFPKTKNYLFDISKENPELLKQYQDILNKKFRVEESLMDEAEQKYTSGVLSDRLKQIIVGHTHASNYHSLMIGICEFIFYPSLTRPRKEYEIHEGRKRIDIFMDNSAIGGFFKQLSSLKEINPISVIIECKNYRDEINNPEIDQLSGRFGYYRGNVGISLSRSFENKTKIFKRCKDTLNDGRGLILPMEDRDVFEMLDNIRAGDRVANESVLMGILEKVKN